MGVGNSCALSHLANILRGATGTWKKPWGMRPDGDVWAILECIVDARGRGATKCSKDKGHATDEDVRLGRVSVVDKAGNDIADRMVHKGYATYGERRRALCQFHEQRRTEYAAFIGKVQAMMLAIIAATRQRRDDITGNIFGSGTRPQRFVHVVVPTLGNRQEARQIRLSTQHMQLAVSQRPKGWRGHIAAYLCDLEWIPRPANSKDMGCSWLELLIDFELVTRPLSAVRSCCSVTTQPSSADNMAEDLQHGGGKQRVADSCEVWEKRLHLQGRRTTCNVKGLLQYRMLTILPAIYRAWTNMRYRRTAD